jgi:hypothetical protein
MAMARCYDDQDICKTDMEILDVYRNLGEIKPKKDYYYSMEPNVNGTIPENYFCNWTFVTDYESEYSMYIERYYP